LQTYEKTLHLNLYSHRDRSYADGGIEHFNAEVDVLMEHARRDMEEEGFDLANVDFQLDIHICYGQQRQTLPIRVPGLRLKGSGDVQTVCDRFNDAYAEKYGKGACYPEAGIEMVEMRLNAVGPADKYKLHPLEPDPDPERWREGGRQAYWGSDHGFVETPVYRREGMGADIEIAGPALFEAEDTVIVTPPGWRFRTDRWGTGWIERVS